MYNAPEVIIKNIDNLVYRDTPYNLEFQIIAPTLINPATEEFDYISKIPMPESENAEDSIYEFSVNKEDWSFDENGNVKISNFRISKNDDNQNILFVTGLYPVKYSYKISFNDKELKSINNIIENREDSIVISYNDFNNFVDGKIKIEVLYGTDLVYTKEYNLQLINTKPNIIFGDVINNKLDLTITDAELDNIKLNIKINGKNYYPSNGEFTDFVSTPYFYTTYFSSDLLNIDPYDFITPNNIITVTVQDKYGAETQMHKSFVGEFIGIMFVNNQNEFYSDDTNNYVDDANILREQYLGNIKAGTQGEKKIVYLLNKTKFKLTNIKLQLNTVGIPDKTYVKISKDLTTNFNNMSDIIDFGYLELNVGQKLSFYVQANTEILSLGGGYYYIDVIADPVD